MFDNLFYIYSNDKRIINKYINENQDNFEIKKLKYEIIKKDNEIKILQKKYNKLLKNYIINDINNKNKHVDNNIIIDPYIKYNKNISTQYSISDIDICDEYEKV